MRTTRRVVSVGASALLLAAMVLALNAWQPSEAAQGSTDVPRVNVPYDVPLPQHAIFWFGEVYMENNHANVRVAYDDEGLIVHVHSSDRRLWFDDSPSAAELTKWDAITLYLDPAAGDTRYQFVGQLTANGDSAGVYQAGYRSDGPGWETSSAPFTVNTGWRGDGVNDGADDRGWWIKFAIPYSTLGLSSAPQTGALWRAAVSMHDRDAANSPPLPIRTWPEGADVQQSASWGQLHFGFPTYNPPPSVMQGQVTIRNGVNGAVVRDAHVGGHSICGRDTRFWTEWGSANYAGYEQINVQNQWDIADGPCYSRYYITFPLDAIPDDASVIMNGSLTMYQFGSAGQEVEEELPPSYLQVLTIDEAWDEQTLTWNNAPLAVENRNGAWVEPFTGDDFWPGRPIKWDVTRAVAEARAAGQPLRLVLYSADTAYHSGRYFWSSDAKLEGRPKLQVTWGQPLNEVDKHFLPFLLSN